LKVEKRIVGKIIGKKGSVIKKLMRESGCRIFIKKEPKESAGKFSEIILRGSTQDIQLAI
jgi:predicted PilT family ATPase